jgi:hypothetical protein
MNTSTPVPEPAVRGVDSTFWCAHGVELAAIFDPEVNVAVWRRSAVPDLTTTLSAGLDRDREVRTTVDPATPSFCALGLDAWNPETRAALDTDLREIVDMFGALAECELVGLRLVVTAAPMCPRFHVDHVALRAVVTYVGEGTEWVDHRDLDRRRLGHAAGGVADEHSGLLLADAQVWSAKPFDLVVLKGTAWPGNETRGAVHRSPTPRSGRRLVVTLDAL